MRALAPAAGSAVVLLALSVITSSCSDADLGGRLLFVDAEGAVLGLVYLDHNGNQVRDLSDEPVEGMQIRNLYLRS